MCRQRLDYRRWRRFLSYTLSARSLSNITEKCVLVFLILHRHEREHFQTPAFYRRRINGQRKKRRSSKSSHYTRVS